jgi:hypothetical protein
MNTNIKAMLLSRGWQEARKILKEEIVAMCDCRNLKATEEKERGAEALAKSEACKIVNTMITRLEREAGNDTKETVMYV